MKMAFEDLGYWRWYKSLPRRDRDYLKSYRTKWRQRMGKWDLGEELRRIAEETHITNSFLIWEFMEERT